MYGFIETATCISRSYVFGIDSTRYLK